MTLSTKQEASAELQPDREPALVAQASGSTWQDRNLTAYVTIVRKEVRRFLRIWVQTITPPAINALLYLVIFGGLIGSRISEMGGVSYMSFIMPGIIMMGIIMNSYANVSSSFFSAKFQNSIEEMLVAPLSNCLLYTSPSPRDGLLSRMPSSA